MSSQKGNVNRSRSQKHQNSTAFRNDKYGATVQVKKAKSKIHDGLCQHCKGVLEWKIRYNKYKSLTQPRKCVKCSQKTVKDAYHIICKPCSLQLELCAKCGKKEDIIIPINSQTRNDQDQREEDNEKEKGGGQRKKNLDSDDDDDDDDYFGIVDDEEEDEEDNDFDSDLGPRKTQSKSAVHPDLSCVNINDQ
ncbi:uncharacterized protein C9orf85 homolog [Lampris incognitus]|uniref:uncharacterized protein C9orf85 homolog n=1 Tax=Lampris incognitus TaxID=2546036 RepID=UPI0024B55D98|nr:uncharacterized protein C9orf85 homolog [Lampris incognitus]